MRPTRFIPGISARTAALVAALIPISLFSTTAPLGAQARTRTDGGDDRGARITRYPDLMTLSVGRSDRAVLGITMREARARDIDGVYVESVSPDGPAAKAGLKAGDVITSINGTSLRISSADAEDPATASLAQRRLSRILDRARAGDDVTLRVETGGQARTLTVRTVTAAELSGASRSTARVVPNGSIGRTDDTRGTIGLSLGGSGTSRDTLGLFITSVVPGGPAERAGIVEGDRIASVNGVDVRVPKEDTDDPSAVSARASRFLRESGKVTPGGQLMLRVYSNGRYRETTVTAVRRSELPARNGFRMSIGDGDLDFAFPSVVVPRGQFRIDGLDGLNGISRFNFDGAEGMEGLERLREQLRGLRELRNLPELQGRLQLRDPERRTDGQQRRGDG